MIYLFVLASKQGVLRPEKTIKSPLPSSPSLSAPRTHTALCALAEALLRQPAGGKKHATVDHLKTIHFAGPWPEGLDSITPTVREMGLDSGEESASVQTRQYLHPNKGTGGGLLAEFLS